jgi:hypothetical protein
MMFRHAALPLYQQILYDIIIPPVGAAIWLLMSKGWSGALGTTDSQAVRGWTKSGFWALLVAAYVLMFSITIYAYFTRR